ncbi:MAG: glycerol-3-phosphate 1-O-acyltransferase PlsY [Alphaproteobacteria bacterium]|nr:glycerol-3-phosphate 1-O-acyltransferase PlsY [Alphaproteobacteria bacterium]
MTSDILISIIIGYFLGSIPFGYLLTKMSGGGDIRNIGSGNIGATNVLRTGRKSLALATLILDAGKGAFSIFIVGLLLADAYLWLVGLSAVLGHCFPIWLKFKGGKGVATGLAVIAALSPISGITFIITWLIMASLSRYSSLAALSGFTTSLVSASIFASSDITIAILGISLLSFIRHRENIIRLFTGSESKISFSPSFRKEN